MREVIKYAEEKGPRFERILAGTHSWEAALPTQAPRRLSDRIAGQCPETLSGPREGRAYVDFSRESHPLLNHAKPSRA